MEYNKRIADMQLHDQVMGFYLLKDGMVKTSANGSSFLAGTLEDVTGTVELKKWDFVPTDGVEPGKIIKVQGEVSEYRGTMQFVAAQIRGVVPTDVYPLEELVPTAPIDRDARMTEVEALVASLQDADYQKVAQALLERHRKAFMTIPAAKSVHHSFLSGLLMHTSNMLRLADFLSGLYADIIDRSLLLTATLAHDFAKEQEYLFSELGLVTDYSVKGQLIGHPVLGAEEVGQIGRELHLPEEKILLLQHLILSHHGEPEFGAALKPRCAEAQLLHYIDLIDSHMEIYAEVLQDVEPGSFSDSVFALDRIKIYKHR